MPGETQIGNVLTHALREANQRKVNAVVFVGDCCEESRDKLVGPAKQLAGLKVPVFMFQEGGDQIARMRFQEIAELTHGATTDSIREAPGSWARCLKPLPRLLSVVL